jgi:hypothetical protein
MSRPRDAGGSVISWIEGCPMTKHSRYESARRAAEDARIREIEAAWIGSLPAETMQTFTHAVEAARRRPPSGPAPNMPPGTRPNPPRVEPRPAKEERSRRPGRG